MAQGVIAFDGNSLGEVMCQVGQICEGLGHATNNVAEYTGLLRGLEAALACGAVRIKCQGDSKLVVEQVQIIIGLRILQT